LPRAEAAEEEPAPVTQEGELPADESQEEAEAAPDAEPTSVPAEDETEEGIVEAEGDASIEAPVEEGRVEAEGESFIEAPAKQTSVERTSEPEKTEEDGDCDGDARCAEPVCSEDSVVNGSFASPDVKNGYVWDYFDNNEVSGWEAEWYGGSSSFQNLNRPQPKIEIQAGLYGWAPESEQYAELDSDWDGPNGSVSGEPASISLKQTIPTVPGYGYVLTWDYSARPNHADNKLKVEVDGDSMSSRAARSPVAEASIGSRNRMRSPLRMISRRSASRKPADPIRSACSSIMSVWNASGRKIQPKEG
jgi:hypothetical protein